MRRLDLAKNLILLLIGIIACVLLIAEGETWRQTIVIKFAACALIGCDLLLYSEWKDELNKIDN